MHENVTRLLQAGASIDLHNEHGTTALMKAAFENSVDSVELLLRWRAATDIQNKHQLSALQIAAAEGYAELVGMLVRSGAAKHLRDRAGLTALEKARKEDSRASRAVVTELEDYAEVVGVDRPELNGRRVLVTEWSQMQERYKCRPPEGKSVLLAPRNLILLIGSVVNVEATPEATALQPLAFAALAKLKQKRVTIHRHDERAGEYEAKSVCPGEDGPVTK